MLKSRKLFKNTQQSKNATLVQYADNKIFALGIKKARLHILDLELNVLKVADHQFEGSIMVMKSSESFLGIGDLKGNVTILDHDGNLVLVSYF